MDSLVDIFVSKRLFISKTWRRNMQRLTPTGIYLFLLMAISWLSGVYPELSIHKNQLLIAISMVYFQLLVYWNWIEKRDSIGASFIFIMLSTTTTYLSSNSEISLFKDNYLQILGMNGVIFSLLLIFWVKR